MAGLASFFFGRAPVQAPITPIAKGIASSPKENREPAWTLEEPAVIPKSGKTTEMPKPSAAPSSAGSRKSMPAPDNHTTPETKISFNQNTPSAIIWSSRDGSWSPSGPPPSCLEPFVLKTPVDMSLVTMALWPGQVRGEYKAHGGFRFNNEGTNDITVRAPVGAYLVQASRYLESNEEQYLLFFSVPCGFFYRFDHARVLSPKLTEALKGLAPAPPNDSRTTYINPPVWVEGGEIVSTSIGITNNIFIDFGLYDVRKPNNIIPNPAWTNLYALDKEFGHYGVCFFDYLQGGDGAIMRSLPTGQEGKVSDYCK